MSDHEYSYVECNGCGVETRKVLVGMFQRHPLPPEAWRAITNSAGKKEWDICPDCNAAFVRWLLERSGALQKEAANHDENRETE